MNLFKVLFRLWTELRLRDHVIVATKTGHGGTNLLHRTGGDVRKIIVVHSIAILLGSPRRNAFPGRENVNCALQVV